MSIKKNIDWPVVDKFEQVIQVLKMRGCPLGEKQAFFYNSLIDGMAVSINCYSFGWAPNTSASFRSITSNLDGCQAKSSAALRGAKY